MSLPPFLLAEVRLAFRLCSPQHAAVRRSAFSTSACVQKRRGKLDSSSRPRTPTPSPTSPSPSEPAADKDVAQPGQADSLELVPRKRDATQVDGQRKSNVPMKVLPPSHLTSTERLSPMQRLHIEHMTRHPPAKTAPKVYKERLLIYHYGVGKVNWLVFLRVAAISALGFLTVIWVPAYYSHGTPWYYLALVWAAGFIPIMFINWTTRSIATEVWLRLPPFARQSPQAAMAYAKNLPRDASIDIRFMRWTGHTGTVPINIVDTTPASARLRPVSFRWVGPRVDEGSMFRPNPVQFFVKPRSAEGRAVRDTIPGLWSAVYKRLTGLDSKHVPKWKS